MCYAIPAKLIDIQGSTGTLDYFGEYRKVLLDETDSYHLGDYVFAQGGIVVSKLAEDEALEILKAWKDIFFELKQIDQKTAEIDSEKLSSNVLAILQKANVGQPITREDALHLFQLNRPEELSVLFEVANAVRQKAHGNASCVHGIIEFSNYCKHSCAYCGIRKERSIPRYRMTVDEIISIAQEAVERRGFKAIVLQSGEDDYYDDERLIEIVRSIKKMGVLVFLSIGLRKADTYQKLYQAGARAALLRFETSNAITFEAMRPNTSWKERIDLLHELKQMGYIIATGFLLGLPGETHEDILNHILLTQSFQPDMYSFGPLIPTAETPLEDHPRLTKESILKVIAITRLLDRDSNILVTTALETLDPSAKKEALLAGANSMMINLTPPEYREKYSIYDHRACNDQAVDESIQATVQLLLSLGRSPTDLSIHLSKHKN